MERELFFALGLHLLTEQQLYWLICGVCYVELIIMLIIMWKKKYFIEKIDIVYLIIAIQMLAYVLFKVEHVTFFFSIFYITLFLLLIFLICRQYTKHDN
jgi:hypothetical protein